MICLYHTVYIQAQTDDDEPEDCGKKDRRKTIGEFLGLSEWGIDMEPLCKPATALNLLLILFSVLGVILVRHLLPNDELLPTHGENI